MHRLRFALVKSELPGASRKCSPRDAKRAKEVFRLWRKFKLKKSPNESHLDGIVDQEISGAFVHHLRGLSRGRGDSFVFWFAFQLNLTVNMGIKSISEFAIYPL